MKKKDARPTPRHKPFGPFLPPSSKHLFEVPSARTEVIDIVAPRGGREPLPLLVGEVVRLETTPLAGTVVVVVVVGRCCGTGRGGGGGEESGGRMRRRRKWRWSDGGRVLHRFNGRAGDHIHKQRGVESAPCLNQGIKGGGFGKQQQEGEAVEYTPRAQRPTDRFLQAR